MTADPLYMLVVDILGKYAIDKGATLLNEAGQAATQIALQLCEYVLIQLKADPAEAKNAERFEKDPEGYRTPVADALAEKTDSDPEFTARLSALLHDYQEAVSRNSPTINGNSGVVATQGSIAAAEGGVAVAGNVAGNITINNSHTSYLSKGLAG